MVITLSVRGNYTGFWGRLLQPCCNEASYLLDREAPRHKSGSRREATDEGTRTGYFGIHRSRRCKRLLRNIRRWRTDGSADADVSDRLFAHVESSGGLPRAAPSRNHLRPAR